MAVPLDNDRIPAGYNAVNPFILVTGAGGAAGFIAFLEEVFDGTERAGLRTPDRDGSIIHAEVRIGDSSLLIADSKAGWPFTPAFEQLYVDDIQTVLDRAAAAGGEVVTPRTPFYNGVNIARMLDPWGNLWWLYELAGATGEREQGSDTSWHDRDPSTVYTTLMDVMSALASRQAGRDPGVLPESS